MATINRNGTNGTNGTSGASPTAGTNGTDAPAYTLNGTIGADSSTVIAVGGNGGAGGNGTAVPGANGGNGGNASITENGNIFNAPASTSILVSLSATGGNGGAGGTGTTPGTQGKGGNATVTANGNIFQPNKALTSIELDAIATGGTGTPPGNASATLNGNVFQSSKAVGTVTLHASATGQGTNTATLNGNVVQNNVNFVNLSADATPVNGTASVSGNIVQTGATNTGTVTLEASGNHIAITNNKITLGLQELDFTINPYSPYDTTITGNQFKGLGTNKFVFTENPHPGPHTDTLTIDLTAGTMVFDGQASNTITGFNNIAVSGTGVNATLVGTSGADTLAGGDGSDTFTGGAGNDTINGGLGIDTAIFSGNFAQYTFAPFVANGGTVTGPDGTDTLTGIEFLKFNDGTYNTTTNTFALVNHAPVLDATKSPTLASEAINAPTPAGPVGTLVSSLVDLTTPPGGLDNVTDTDAGALTGIALSGTDTANGTWFYSTNNGATWQTVGTVSDSSALLLAADAGTRLYFVPAANYTGTDAGAITFHAWDRTTGTNGQTGVDVSGANNGGSTAFSTATDTASITVSAGNTAPVLNAAASPTLAAELEDAGVPVGVVGTLVSSLVDLTTPAGGLDNVTDPDAGAVTGLALTATDNANGTWFYSTNNGTSWAAVGPVSNASALLLAADANTRLYFQPNANFNGTDNGAITFRAWDQTSGTAGTKVDTTTNGGATAFSVATDTAALTITPVNDAPVGTPNTITLNEDGSHIFTAAEFGFTDPVDAASASGANSLFAVEITTLPANGSLKDNGVAVTAGQFVSAADIAGGLLVFTPAPDANGANYGNFTFQVQDNGGTANGGVNTDTTARLMTVNVTAVNDAPVLDVSKSPVLNSEAQNAPAPVGMVGTLVSALVDLTTPAGGLDNVTDVDSGAVTGLALTATDTANGNWFYSTNNGTTWAAVGAVSSASALLLAADANTRLYFQPNPGFSGTDANAIIFRAWDQTSGTAGTKVDTSLNGGTTAFSTATDTASLTVTGVNTAPVLDATKSPTLAAELEDAGAPVGVVGSLVSSLVDLTNPAGGLDNVTDPDTTTTTGLALTATDNANGTWFYTTNNGTSWAAVGPVSNASALLLAADANTRLYFQPNANFNGTDTGAITFRAWDQTSGTAGTKVDTTLNGGTTAFSVATDTAALTITSVNDAPAGTDKIITRFEDQGAYTLATTDFGFTDPADAASAAGANALANVIITTVPTNGTLLYNNGITTTPVVAGQSVSAADIALGRLTFAPGANVNGVANFTFQVQDNGGTANGGQDTDQTPNNIIFNITPVNDAPVGTANTVTTNEDTGLTFTTAMFGFTDPADAASASGANALQAVKITTLPTNGSLKDNGVAVTAGQFVSAADIAGGLLVFTPAANANGAGYGNFTFQVQDDGGTSNGGVNTDTTARLMTVNVTPVNDAPVAVNDSYTTGFNTPLIVGAPGLLANDTDVDGDTLQVSGVTAPTNGMLTPNADGSFTYTPNAGFVGTDTFTYQDSDGTTTSNFATVNITVTGQTGAGPLTGTNGDDTFVPVVGTTSIDGLGNTPTGGDTVVFSNATSGITSSTDGAQDWTSGGLGMTTLANIENLTGSDFDDVLSGTDGVRNTLTGGNGNDILVATTGDGVNGDTLDGGAGSDTADFSNSVNGVTVHLDLAAQNVGGDIGDITLTSIENVVGTAGDDVIYGNSGDNNLDGGAGGNDTVSYANATADGLVVNLTLGTAHGGGAGNDTLSNFQTVAGSSFADTLIGDANANTLAGGDGNDILYGHGGMNIIAGGDGTDVAYYAGREADPAYTTVNLTQVVGGPEAVADSLSGIERLKFLSPTHVMDVDNSGTGDVIVQNTTTGDLTIHTQPLGTIMVTGVNGPANVNGVFRAVGTGQFNPDADRAADVLLQDTVTGNLEVITGLGVTNTVTQLSSQPGSNAWKAITAGDFNGEASSDVLLQNQSTGAVQILFLDKGSNVPTDPVEAVGTVDGTSIIATPGANWKAIAAGDFNADGKSDILWQNSATKQVEVYLMDGASVTNTPAAQTATGLTAIGTGDFNGDGSSDILFQNASGQAVIWLMNGDSHVSTRTVAKPGAGTWAVSGAEDLDNNGVSDIIWTNNATGIVGASLLTAATATAVPNLTSFSTTSQHLVTSTGGG